MIYREMTDMERAQQLVNDFTRGKCLNPIWVVRAYAATLVMLSKAIRDVGTGGLNLRGFRFTAPVPTITVNTYTCPQEEENYDDYDEEDHYEAGCDEEGYDDEDSCSAYDNGYDDGYDAGYCDGLNDTPEDEQEAGCDDEDEPDEDAEPLKVDSNASKYFVGKRANYWLGPNYYHNAEVVEFVPAGKTPSRSLWKKIGHKDSYVPRIRTYDSLVVKLENGNYCFPPLNAHKEVGVI